MDLPQTIQPAPDPAAKVGVLLYDTTVEVDEAPPKPRAELSPDRAFAGTRETNEDDGFVLCHMLIVQASGPGWQCGACRERGWRFRWRRHRQSAHPGFPPSAAR